MIKVGITGGIGSGKSVVCKVFKNLNIPVFDADYAARMIMLTDTDVVSKLTQKFGEDIYINKSEINRKKLASIIFNDTEAIQFINSVVHPVVLHNFSAWSKEQTSLYCIIETAILFEGGVDELVDDVIAVYAPEEIRIRRVMERDGISEEEVRSKIRNQMNEEEKIEKAGFIIYNDDQKMVIPQVIQLHNIFSAS